MQVRHLVIAALLVTAGAAQAQTARHPGTLTGWAVTGGAVAASSAVAAPSVTAPSVAVESPAPAVIAPVAAEPVQVPVAADPVVTAPAAAEVPEPSSIALLLAGAMGVGALRRRRAK
ncbi:PEP-CTERM sorting domain-containing protein [Massilia sp. IC2-278]|uniref:PEP-CTERM sorting domain-containing protein n=1 Tax=Massilia sp. IC2-278 TaxID=2887200 RepID=UPI001E46D97B|nr:PEP-CTERM sorting domain-containing protein [Massilia sp. IC2-278]MCC2959189.1 PEP-CTERM sorting domain-containing protein [Massilia sp. IC2-278]